MMPGQARLDMTWLQVQKVQQLVLVCLHGNPCDHGLLHHLQACELRWVRESLSEGCNLAVAHYCHPQTDPQDRCY